MGVPALSFSAFHPKALNTVTDLAGLLACALFRRPSHVQKKNTVACGLANNYSLTVAGTALAFNKIPF